MSIAICLRHLRSPLLAALLLTAGACRQDHSGPAQAEPGRRTTYRQDIQPILAEHCTKCHASSLEGAARMGAPFGVDYDRYELTRATALRALQAIQAGSMPPGGLPREQRSTFKAWLDQGLAE